MGKDLDASLSIIIPFGPGEDLGHRTLRRLASWANKAEIILVPCETRKDLKALSQELNLKYFEAQKGRAQQMNAGARIATRDFIWFLHADSQLGLEALQALYKCLRNNPDDLIYFDLSFEESAPGIMMINEIGTFIRSHLLNMPFGDQGFCMKRSNFLNIGGFKENLQYGEDHDFVWRWRQQGLHLKSTGRSIVTSSRKYQEKGWLRTTGQHIIKTYLQAGPEFQRYLRKRIL